MVSLLEAFRGRRSPPEARLADAGVEKWMKVLDVGAGYGFFAIPAAEIVGGEGFVCAVEPNPKRAREIERRAGDDVLKNLKVLVTGAEDLSGIPTGEVDVAISMSSFHHFSDPARALAELGRVVRKGDLLYVRDMKAGRVFKHGSVPDDFRAEISRAFPGARYEEGSGYLVARVTV